MFNSTSRAQVDLNSPTAIKLQPRGSTAAEVYNHHITMPHRSHRTSFVHGTDLAGNKNRQLSGTLILFSLRMWIRSRNSHQPLCQKKNLAQNNNNSKINKMAKFYENATTIDDIRCKSGLTLPNGKKQLSKTSCIYFINLFSEV